MLFLISTIYTTDSYLYVLNFYPSPSSGEAYRDWRLSTNFDFWIKIFCVPTCFHVRIPKPCLSVCTPRKEITLASSISVLHKSLWELYHGNPNINFEFFSKKFEIDEIELCPYPEWLYPKKRNRPGLVSISLTLVSDTSMERSLWVQQHGNPQNLNFFKFWNWILTSYC